LYGGTEKNHDTVISTAGLHDEISTQDILHTKLHFNTKYRGEDISKHFALCDGNIEIREKRKKTKKQEVMAEKNERHGRIASNPCIYPKSRVQIPLK
jgi:hypothetical protein